MSRTSGKRYVNWIALGCLLAGPIVAVATAAGAGPLQPYGLLRIDIINERNSRGQKLPDEYVPKLRDSLTAAIGQLHQFHSIDDIVDRDVRSGVSDRAIRMIVRISGYSGAQNQAEVTADVTFVDVRGESEVMRQSVRAKLYYDKGAMTAALRKLSRSIASVVRDGR